MQKVRNIIDIVFDNISKLSDEELNKLINKEAKLVCVDVKNKANKKVDTDVSDINKDILDICDNLKMVNSREEGYHILQDKSIKKNMLLDISKYMDIHIQKNYTKAKIIDCIIESTIGYRVDTEAISNIDIK